MLERRENVIVKKTELFADRIVKMCKYLSEKKTGDKDMIRQIYLVGISLRKNTIPLNQIMKKSSKY